MELTQKQKEFLDRVCGKENWTLNGDGEVDVHHSVNMNGANITEIPIKFGVVNGYFDCSNNKLTTLNNLPRDCKFDIYCWGNNLKDYFKNIQIYDLSFEIWGMLDFYNLIEEYPFLINIASGLFGRGVVEIYLNDYPQTKIYYRD